VGDEDEGFALAVQVVEEIEDFFAGLGVEVAGGFVGEDDERAVGKGAGDGDALLLAAGKLVGLVIRRWSRPTWVASWVATSRIFRRWHRRNTWARRCFPGR
jgi:hypothetical protein